MKNQFFKSIELPQSEEVVLLVKHHDPENKKFVTKMMMNVDGFTHTADLAFEKEEERDEMYDKFDEEQASNFISFMYDSVIKR